MSGSGDDPGRGGEAPEAGSSRAEPCVTNQPQPFGILSTFGWLIAAFAAAMLSAILVLCVAVFLFDVGHDDTLTNPPSDSILAVVSCALAVAMALFFAVLVAACRRSGWQATKYLGLTRPRGCYLLAGLAAFLFPVLFSLIAARFGPLAADDPPVTTGLALSLLVVEVVIQAPVSEELIFRGFLYRGLARSRLGVGGAIVVTSILWAAVHTDRTWLGCLSLLPAGIALGWLRWRSDSTIPTISVHAVHNILSVAFGFGWRTPH